MDQETAVDLVRQAEGTIVEPSSERGRNRVWFLLRDFETVTTSDGFVNNVMYPA